MTPVVSIFSLVYRSYEYAEFITEVVRRYTPEIEAGIAEFYLVANNPTSRLRKWLKNSDVTSYHFDKKQPKSNNSCGPDYLRGVYAAYNFGVEMASAPKVVMLNSDMVPSRGWLEAMLLEAKQELALAAHLVEPYHPQYGVFPGALLANLGSNLKDFDFEKWDALVDGYQGLGTGSQNAAPYMPVLIDREVFLSAGGFPPGNVFIAGECVAGDEFLFNHLRQTHQITHRKTSRPVLFYHFKEGEKSTEFLHRIRTRVLPRTVNLLGLRSTISKVLKALGKLRASRAKSSGKKA